MRLPSLHKLSLASRTGMAPGDDEREECYFVTFADDVVLVLGIRYYTNDVKQDVVAFRVRSGGRISFELPIPSSDATRASASDEPGQYSSWETSIDARPLVARYIVAFAAIIRELYPQLDQVWYRNSAIRDPVDVTDLDANEDLLREVAEKALYRVRYYERLGFVFDVPYAEQLKDTVKELTAEPVQEEDEYIQFAGELLSMAKHTIPQTYPGACTLKHLHRGVCVS